MEHLVVSQSGTQHPSQHPTQPSSQHLEVPPPKCSRYGLIEHYVLKDFPFLRPLFVYLEEQSFRFVKDEHNYWVYDFHGDHMIATVQIRLRIHEQRIVVKLDVDRSCSLAECPVEAFFHEEKFEFDVDQVAEWTATIAASLEPIITQ